MKKKLSAHVLPELFDRLKQGGLLTSISTLESLRFRRYLKRPGNLLHDGWTYIEVEGESSVTYRLGDLRGLHQELVLCRQTKVARLTTRDPKASRCQVIEFSTREKGIARNEVRHELPGQNLVHNYFHLNRSEGLLRKAVSAA